MQRQATCVRCALVNQMCGTVIVTGEKWQVQAGRTQAETGAETQADKQTFWWGI